MAAEVLLQHFRYARAQSFCICLHSMGFDYRTAYLSLRLIRRGLEEYSRTILNDWGIKLATGTPPKKI